MIDKTRLQQAAEQYAIHLEPCQLQQLERYAAMLVDWNARINLTAITAPEEIEAKHFLDSLLLANQPEVQGRLVDVGSGAGFPGMVAKIYKPMLEITLMEPTGKRLQFLQQLAQALDVQVDLLKERGEEAARKQWRGIFDVATARAVAALPALCEYCMPLLRVDGLFIAMKAEPEQELAVAEGAIKKLGGRLETVRSYQLPDGAARSLILIRKVEDTPKQYPRAGGVIAKRPL